MSFKDKLYFIVLAKKRRACDTSLSNHFDRSSLSPFLSPFPIEHRKKLWHKYFDYFRGSKDLGFGLGDSRNDGLAQMSTTCCLMRPKPDNMFLLEVISQRIQRKQNIRW